MNEHELTPRIRILVVAGIVMAALALAAWLWIPRPNGTPETAAAPALGGDPGPRWNGEPLEKPAGSFGLAQAADPDDPRHHTPRGFLHLTVPRMERIKDVAVPTASGADTAALDANAAIHLKGTGYPWERGKNVYIAGHRLGYKDTKSYLAFRDIDRLRKGDEILLKDGSGKEYRYTVFETLRVRPDDVSVLRPIPNKSVLTLQSCSLPDYTSRLIVRAEKTL